jgi:drug/metabolite transporter (DMT)-like permease
MILWGSLFPMIKIGYAAFEIESTSIPDIIMFASCRFTLCGIILCSICLVRKEKIAVPVKSNVFKILLLGLFSIVLHYAFTYIGLAFTDGSKTALLKQLGVLFYICFAFLFIKDEKFSVFKIVGAIVGFAGLVAINVSGQGVTFAFGDILIILASVCTVISSVMNKSVAKNNSAFWVNGLSQFSGGLIMLIAALIMGGKIPKITPWAIFVFMYICTASMIAYVLYTYLLRTVSVSKMFIIKFTEPLFACIFGAMWLGEDIFKIQYLVAFLLISTGIILGNKSKENKGEEK